MYYEITFRDTQGKHVRRWWAARSSKPVEGMRNLLGGFDSHVLPPFNRLLKNSHLATVLDAFRESS